MRLIKEAMARPVLLAAVYVVIFLFGLVAATQLPIDLMPKIELPVLSVVTVYPGASADDVEQKLSRELEEAMGSVSRIKEIRSTSRENLSVVVLQFEFDTDLDQAANDVRARVEQLRNKLPAAAREPQIRKFDTATFPVLFFAVSSTTSDVRLQERYLERKVFDPLRRVPGVGQVFASNLPEAVVRVDVHGARLRAHGLTLTQVARALAAENLNVPAGTIDVGKTEFSLRMPGKVTSLEQLGQLVLLRGASGGVVRLRQIATISAGIDDETELALIDGKVGVAGSVIKVAGANSVDVARAARRRLEQIKQSLPAGMELHVITDTSALVGEMIGNLERTVSIGGVLVILVAFAFLRRLRPSLIVATTIPASMVLTFLVLQMAGLSLNFSTLLAMALAIGMVVDNGIVVLENIMRLRAEGHSPREAALRGASEVSGAMFASTSTTLVIFLPLLFVSGMIGILFRQLAYVMIVTIGGSLLVALTLTPALAARLLKPKRGYAPGAAGSITARREGAVERALSRLERWYQRRLTSAMRHPWRVIGAGLAMMLLTGALVLMVGTDFMPHQDSGEVQIVLELPVGTRLQETVAVGKKVAAALERQPEMRLVMLIAGMNPSGMGSLGGAKEGSNVVRIEGRLVGKDRRDRSDLQIARAAVAQAGPLPEVINLQINVGTAIGRALGIEGKPVAVEVLGADVKQLEQVASRVRTRIAAIDGTTEVSADLLQTRPEMRLELSRELASRAHVPLGLAAAELRASTTGVRATRYRQGKQVLDVVVRLRAEDRDDVGDLELIPVRGGPAGKLVALGDITQRREGEAPVEIKRADKARIVTVNADIVGRALGSVALDVDEVIRSANPPPGVVVRYGGAVKQQRESFIDMFVLLAMGLVLVYLVLAAQLESWLDPLVVLLSVPFAITGAFLALAVTGTLLTTPAFLGLIILVGVVVNNAIVLLEYVRRLQRQGTDVVQAIITAGGRRMRPVLMTTLTTAGGMLPLALATGDGAELWAPMGRTAMGGLLVSTVVTLIFVPTLYSLVHRWRQRAARKASSPGPAGARGQTPGRSPSWGFDPLPMGAAAVAAAGTLHRADDEFDEADTRIYQPPRRFTIDDQDHDTEVDLINHVLNVHEDVEILN